MCQHGLCYLIYVGPCACCAVRVCLLFWIFPVRHDAVKLWCQWCLWCHVLFIFLYVYDFSFLWYILWCISLCCHFSCWNQRISFYVSLSIPLKCGGWVGFAFFRTPCSLCARPPIPCVYVFDCESFLLESECGLFPFSSPSLRMRRWMAQQIPTYLTESEKRGAIIIIVMLLWSCAFCGHDVFIIIFISWILYKARGVAMLTAFVFKVIILISEKVERRVRKVQKRGSQQNRHLCA